MLSIRMQRLGRKGYPTYRIVVQDKRQAPTSGKYIALLGSYNPHTKQSSLVKEKVEFYLNNGAQPSERVVKLFKTEKIKLPNWVSEPNEQKRVIKNTDKLRRNRPAEEKPVEKTSTEAAGDEEATASTEPEADKSSSVEATTTNDENESSSEPEGQQSEPEADGVDKKES